MFAVRYVALAALALWVGGMLLYLVAGSGSPELLRIVQRLAVVCGAAILVALVAMKFIGPPPEAFFLRAGIVGAMLAIAIYALLAAAQHSSRPLIILNTVGGLFLLAYYARE